MGQKIVGRTSESPRFDPEALLAFGAIAKAGGVRGAAERLGVPRSTLSRRLLALEAQIGAPLVVRTARRFSLTELGERLAGACEDVTRALDAAGAVARSASQEPSGVLRVAVAPVLGEEILPRILAELTAAHPRLSIDARLSPDKVDLRKGDVDVALRAAVLEDATDLFAVRLGISVSGCYASPGYLDRRGAPSRPSQLAQHDCVLVGGRPRVTWTFRSSGREQTVIVSGRVRVDNYRVARDAAVRGVGIVRLATIFAAPLVERGELAPLLERWWPRVPVYAVHAGPSPAPPSVRAFIDAARAASAGVLSAS
jgi:DNA-binding transcriptional LysR family regulator